jgi:hypothetical protein
VTTVLANQARDSTFANAGNSANDVAQNEPAVVEGAMPPNPAMPPKFTDRIDVSKPATSASPVQLGRGRFQLLHQWEGEVVSIGEESFTARLTSLIESRRPNEFGDILLSEVDDDDLSLLVPGAVFYWTISYNMTRKSVKTRQSTIRLRRVPHWTRERLDQLLASDDPVADFFGRAAE